MELDGVTYRKRDDLTVILAMGVDHETQDEYEYRKAGQADFLRLIVLDNKKKTVQQLQIDRDTITPVTMLGVLGDRYEPVTQQICLGYAFGDGRQSSCEVTVEAVENLLGGQKIDQYLSMGLDGISTLNDLAGGVTVTLEDDFSAIDPAMTKGTTLTLWGDQAEVYVRTRRSIGVGTDEARMVRQEQYIRQITGQLDEKVRQDQNFVLTAYDALEPYLYTNIPRGQLANEAWAAKDYERLETIKPEGTYQVGDDGFMEFYPDAAARRRLLTLDGTDWVLLEFVPDVTARELEEAVSAVAFAGYRILLAHIERFSALAKGGLLPRLRREYGVCCQVNCAAVLNSGFFQRRKLERWLKEGWVDAVSSDAHNCMSRPTRMKAAYAQLCGWLGQDAAKQLTGQCGSFLD